MNQNPYTPNNGDPSDNQNNSYYGSGAPYGDPYVPPAQTESKGYAVASLVLGIVAIVCCCISELSLICSVLAIVFAVLSRRNAGYFDGKSTAGLVCGIVGAALAVYSIIDGILNPVVLDEKWLEEYMKMLEELMQEAGGEGTAAFRLLQ